jgi:hypothetical protein
LRPVERGQLAEVLRQTLTHLFWLTHRCWCFLLAELRLGLPQRQCELNRTRMLVPRGRTIGGSVVSAAAAMRVEPSDFTR